MKYIGIIGHKGSGRRTFAGILKDSISYMSDENDYEMDFHEILNNNIYHPIMSNSLVTIDSFGRYILDTIKFTYLDLLPLDLTDSIVLYSYQVRLDDLTLHQDKKDQCVSIQHILDQIIPRKNTYLELADFIMYWADTMMKSCFGPNVWTNLMAANERSNRYNSDEYKIYYDVKTKAEYNFIKERDGIIIDLHCPERKQSGGYYRLGKVDPDYTIDIHKDYEGDEKNIWELSRNIIKYFKNDGKKDSTEG